MDSIELAKTLVEYSRWNRGKCVPWWNADMDDPMYKYNYLTKEEI